MSKPNSLGSQPAGQQASPPSGAAAGAGPDARALLQQLPWGVVVLDARNTVLRLNEQAAYWWGQPIQDVQGLPLNEQTARTLPTDLQQALQRVTTSPEPLLGEFFLPQPQQWLAMTSARQGDDWVVYWQDITAQKQLEGHNLARQAASDALLRRTEAVARTGSYELTLATGHFHFSDGLYRLFGAEPGAFVPDLALIDSRSHVGDAAAVRQVLARAIADHRPYYYQRRIYRPDGQLRILECHGRVECDAQGQPVKLLGLLQDVTEREQAAQQQLRMKDELAPRAADNYATLYNSMDEGFCIVEVLFDAEEHPTDYRFLDVNPAFEKQTGLYHALGKTIRELVPAIEPLWADVYGQVARTGEARRFEANVESMSRWFDINAFPIGLLPNRQVGVLFTDISERKRTEEILRQSEEQFRLLVTATSDTVYRMSADWTQMEQLVGKDFLADTQQPSRTWVDEYIPTDDQPLVKATIADAIGRKALYELEHRVRQADGTVGWTYSRAIPVLDAGGEVTGWLGAASDVSGRKQAEAGLRESEERQRVLIENLPGAAVFVVDHELRYQLAAGEALRSAGFEPADFLGRTVREVMPRAHWFVFQGLYQQALEGRAFNYEHEHDGRSFASRGVPLPGPAGRIDAVLAVSYDITDRKAAEEALRVSEAKYRTLFETMDQGFGIGEILPAGPGRAADFRWLEVNPQVERLTSIPQAALLSGETMRTVVPKLEDIWYERYEQVALTGEPVHFEQHAQVLGRWFDVYAFPLGGPVPHRVALLFSNITARKQAEEDLRYAEERHREQLEQQVAERTHALSESRNLLQTVFDASPTAIVVMLILRDAVGQAEDFEILIYNEFNKQVTGRDDIVGQRFTAMFPQTVPTGILARLLAVATTGEPADFEQWYEGEGMRHWFRHIVVRQNELLVMTSEVITARKLLEQAQFRSLALLQQSESVASMGSWEYDLRTHEFAWSDGLYYLLERPVGSPVKLQFFLDAVLDDDRPAAAHLLRTLTTGSAGFDTTLRLRIGEAVKTVRFKAVPMPDAPGPPERVLGVCLDVSDVQRLEAENLALKLDHHKELLMAILQAQENERQRLGEVLHNGLGQILYATKLHLDQLDTPALHALPGLSGLYQLVGHLLADAMRQTRTLAHELVPTSLLDFGLPAAVRDVCRDLSTPQLRIACHVWDEEQEQALPQPVQVTLFRLAQELAHNIVRHAGATQATLELETLPSGVSLRAEDNGRGFDPLTVAEGLGLRTVRQAVALLGGTVAVDSSPEFGTHIRLRIPLPLFSKP